MKFFIISYVNSLERRTYIAILFSWIQCLPVQYSCDLTVNSFGKAFARVRNCLLMKKAHGANRIVEEQTYLWILYKNDTKRRIQEALCKYFKKMLYRPTLFLSITEHIFHCIPHLFCQILSFIHAFVLHMNGLKVNADYIP